MKKTNDEDELFADGVVLFVVIVTFPVWIIPMGLYYCISQLGKLSRIIEKFIDSESK